MSNQTENRLEVEVNETYTVIMDVDGRLFALRNGETWRDCLGDNLIYSLAQELHDVRQRAVKLESDLAFTESQNQEQAMKLNIIFFICFSSGTALLVVALCAGLIGNHTNNNDFKVFSGFCSTIAMVMFIFSVPKIKNNMPTNHTELKRWLAEQLPERLKIIDTTLDVEVSEDFQIVWITSKCQERITTRKVLDTEMEHITRLVEEKLDYNERQQYLWQLFYVIYLIDPLSEKKVPTPEQVVDLIFANWPSRATALKSMLTTRKD
jgi:hypothetical protein